MTADVEPPPSPSTGRAEGGGHEPLEPWPAAPSLDPWGGLPSAGAVTAAGPAALEARWVPLPAGRPRLTRLSSAFADTSRVLRVLAGEGFTGTVELSGPDGRRDTVALLEGQCVAVAVEAGGRRVERPLRLPTTEDEVAVEITVRHHPAAVVVALALALRAPARLRGLDAAFVHLPGLLGHLSRQRQDAAVVVSAPGGSGVVLISGGEAIAAYARRGGEEPGEATETSDVEAVAVLLAEGQGEVDVHDGPLVAPLALEEVIASARRGAASG